jgi:uncharacterized protein (DUF4213/DUF364 family)
MTISFLHTVQNKAREIWQEEGILSEEIYVTARTLSVEEAIGNPEGDDFPLQRGKERLMEAVFRNERGQAFTDCFGDYNASLGEISEMKLNNNFRRAIFIATLNAVQRSIGATIQTIHCRDAGPSHCAPKLAQQIADNYGKVRITQIGYQPKIIEALAGTFQLRVVDLDPDNIGSHKNNILIEGPAATVDAIEQAELLVVTGSTIVNDTLSTFVLESKPAIFYGTTVAATADLMGLTRFCSESS